MPEVEFVHPMRHESLLLTPPSAPAKASIPLPSIGGDHIASAMPALSLHLEKPKELTDAYFQSQQESISQGRSLSVHAMQTAANTIEKFRPTLLPRDVNPSMSEVSQSIHTIANTYDKASNKSDATFVAREAANKLTNSLAMKSAEAYVDGATMRGVFEPSDQRSEKAAQLIGAYAKYYSTAARLVQTSVESGSPSMIDAVINHGLAVSWVKEHFINNSHGDVKRLAFVSIPAEVRPAYATLANERAYHGYS